MTEWTQAQKEAIDARNKDLLISAGAGSGKTAVLTERIIKLVVDDGVDADQFIVMTFTKAAAAEMKRRIRKSLQKELRTSQDKPYIYRQIELLENAHISTIHAFCLSIIKKYYYVIDIDPSSTILGDAEGLILQQEALEMLFESKYEEDDNDFIALVDMYSPGNDDAPIKEIVYDLYRFIMNRPDPWEWLDSACLHFDCNPQDFEEHPAVKYLKTYVNKTLAEADERLKNILKLCDRYDEDGKRTAYFNDIADQFNTLQNTDSFKGLIDTIDTFNWPRYDIRTECEKSEELKQERQLIKDMLNNLQAMFGFSYETYLAQIKALYPMMLELAKTVRAFSEIYTELKQEKTAMDYNDLEQYCLQILKDNTVAEEIRQDNAYVFVDEYQDTNAIQEAIIDRIKRASNLFAVGDIKQSIYRFREAEPDIFMRRYRAYQQTDGSHAKLIFLNRNFRSASAILDGLNAVFKKIMFEETGGVDYYPDEVLTPAKESYLNAKPEVHIVEIPDTQSSYDAADSMQEITGMKKQEAEAAYTASLIKQLLREEIYDETLDRMRPVRPSDIAVVGRSMGYNADHFIQALKDAGIEAESDSNDNYYDETEIDLIVNLLQVIDNEKNDLPLLSVMRSFLFNFTADELLAIRLANKDMLYYHEALHAYADSGEDDALREKINYMLLKFSEYRELSKHVAIEQLLRKLYSDSLILSYMRSLPKGERRSENLKYLLKLASDYEHASFRGLYHFILYIEKCKAQGFSYKISAPSVAEEKVRLLTVHKSKGLEFNIVLFVGCANAFNTSDSRSDMILHKDLGICPTYYDMQKSYKCDTLIKTAAKQNIRDENAAEEMRILYVGATRAKQRLFCIGSLKPSAIEKLFADTSISLYSITKTNHYLGWLIKGILSGETESDTENGEIETKHWKIKTCSYDLIENWETQDEASKTNFVMPTEKSGDYEKIEKLLSFDYPFKHAKEIPSKLSVSQIKDSDILTVGEKIVPLREVPRFAMETQQLNQMQIGTLIHFVMMQLDPLSIISDTLKEDIDRQIDDMLKNGTIDEDEKRYIRPDVLYDFFRSDVGIKLRNAKRIEKESPFIIKMPAREIDKTWNDSEDSILVQGMIDCWFETEDGHLWLIDYKTDMPKDEEQFRSSVKKYTKQIELYDRALHASLGKKADKKFICFLNRRESIEV